MTGHGVTAGASRLALAAFVLLVLALPAQADLRLDLTHGQIQPLPIAIPALAGSDEGRSIAGVVSSDLASSGLFRPLDPASFLETVASGQPPNFPNWRQINAQALVTGSVQSQGDGKLRIEFRLWDVFAAQQLAGFAYTSTPQNWRRIAHIIAD
jgi:TolB protein